MKKTTKNITAAARQYEFFVIRSRQRYRIFCDDCATETEFVSLDDAVLFSGLATREIVRLTETRNLHFLETSGGHLFVCQKSLTQTMTV